MKTFIIQISVFLALIFLMAIGILSLADGNSDGHYAKFTSPRQSSLIIGTSKAAMGLQPKIMNNVLERKDIYNYSFTVGHSPYGPAYLESIKKKINPETQNGIFIVTVDPYSLSSRLKNPDDLVKFRENGRFVDDIKYVNNNPNFEYLIWHYPEQYIYLITSKLNYVNDDFLHDDGWEEINISMKEEILKERVSEKLKQYKKNLLRYNFSQLRASYLEKTIQFLQQHGKVYLVRLPVSKPLLEMENAVTPNFDLMMKKISKTHKVPFFNLTTQSKVYQYIDGNHLYKTSGALVSKKIAEWIKAQE